MKCTVLSDMLWYFFFELQPAGRHWLIYCLCKAPQLQGGITLPPGIVSCVDYCLLSPFIKPHFIGFYSYKDKYYRFVIERN